MCVRACARAPTLHSALHALIPLLLLLPSQTVLPLTISLSLFRFQTRAWQSQERDRLLAVASSHGYPMGMHEATVKARTPALSRACGMTGFDELQRSFDKEAEQLIYEGADVGFYFLFLSPQFSHHVLLT